MSKSLSHPNHPYRSLNQRKVGRSPHALNACFRYGLRCGTRSCSNMNCKVRRPSPSKSPVKVRRPFLPLGQAECLTGRQRLARHRPRTRHSMARSGWFFSTVTIDVTGGRRRLWCVAHQVTKGPRLSLGGLKTRPVMVEVEASLARHPIDVEAMGALVEITKVPTHLYSRWWYGPWPPMYRWRHHSLRHGTSSDRPERPRAHPPR